MEPRETIRSQFDNPVVSFAEAQFFETLITQHSRQGSVFRQFGHQITLPEHVLPGTSVISATAGSAFRASGSAAAFIKVGYSGLANVAFQNTADKLARLREAMAYVSVIK